MCGKSFASSAIPGRQRRIIVSVAKRCLANITAISVTYGWRSHGSRSTVTNVDSAESAEENHSDTVTNAACASPSASSTRTNASRTSTKTTAQFAAKICSRQDNPRRICRAGMPSMLTASGSWLVSIIAAPFARRQWYHSSRWRRLGRLALGILPSIPCRRICNDRSISFATTAKPGAYGRIGTSWEPSAQAAARSTQYRIRRLPEGIQERHPKMDRIGRNFMECH
mmetsp:Transcript_20162/g.56176  ORF Transcript_20162/g.56176 Transcript_20162/m.56176 type:complete len:226 (-) Transcript_20162:434-1111(-)